MPMLTTRVTQLVMHSLPSRRVPMPRNALRLALLRAPRIPIGYYRYLYDAVGRAHHWTSRLLPDDALKAEIHDESCRIHVLYADGAPAGWFELDRNRLPERVRLVHFGILPDFQGRGLARFLLSEAIFAAFEDQPACLVVETNTLDHRAALPLYQKMGFRPIGVRDVTTPAIAD